jgi:hypothetical protein
MMQLAATHTPRSGWSDHNRRSYAVTILAFAQATIEPGYQSLGSKTCLVAVIADEDGRLGTAELSDLKINKTER